MINNIEYLLMEIDEIKEKEEFIRRKVSKLLEEDDYNGPSLGKKLRKALSTLHFYLVSGNEFYSDISNSIEKSLEKEIEKV